MKLGLERDSVGSEQNETSLPWRVTFGWTLTFLVSSFFLLLSAPTEAQESVVPRRVAPKSQPSATPIDRPPRSPNARLTRDTPQISYQAIAGQPFGVASVVFPIGTTESGQLPRVIVTEGQGRLFYPEVDLFQLPPPAPRRDLPSRAIGQGGLVDRLRNAIDNAREQTNPPWGLRVQFLFMGDDPLAISMQGDIQEDFSVIPSENDPTSHAQLLKQWWDGYVAQARRELQAGDYPPGIETYLAQMLSNRLNLPYPDLRSEAQIKRANRFDPATTLELLALTDDMRAEAVHAIMSPRQSQSQVRLRGEAVESTARYPVPSEPQWMDMPVPNTPADLQIESIASRVPPECFYLRFGRFSNFLWFRQLTEAKGGGIGQMLMMRGIDYGANQRVDRMLSTRTNVLAKLFGDQIIADMAIIGLDLYVQDGPAIGVLFEASNVGLLRSSLDSERRSTLNRLKERRGTLEEVTIDGHPATLLQTPDNQVRSFLVQRDRYILLTTSQQIAQRFLEVADGSPSIAFDETFRYTRLLMPLANEYDVFAFFSPQFFRNLVSPQYQIELRRRLRAMVQLQMVEMAQLAAKAEGIATDSISELIDRGFLPETFLDTVDGSRPIQMDGRWVDSRRGGRGSFRPIADTLVNECGPEEVDFYQQQSSFYSSSWKQTDPLMVGIRKFAVEGKPNVEQLGIEAYIAPFGREKYGWISNFLAPPVTTAIELPPDDVMNLQMHLSGETILSLSRVPDHVMFLGVKDMLPPPPKSNRGILETLRMLQTTPAYLGAWPLPGYLNRLPLGLGGGPADALGFSKLLIGAWRWQGGGFSVLSFDRSILENCMLYLKPVSVADPAQVRGFVGDLENTQLSSWFNTYWYRLGLQASRGNGLLLDKIQTQFKVSPDLARQTAEGFLDGKMQCPLGGDYRQLDAGPFWASTAWPNETPLLGMGVIPDQAFPAQDYRAPWLGWFRGAQVHFTQMPSQLILLATVELEKLPPPPGAESDNSNLPVMNFDLFNAPFQFFRGQQKSSPDAPEGAAPQDAETNNKELEFRRAF